MNHLRRHWISYAILLAVAGTGLRYASTRFDLEEKAVKTTDSTDAVGGRKFYTIRPQYPAFDLAGNFLASAAISIFVSQIVIRAFQKFEREAFEKTLLSFQQDTAKDAILSVFKQVIQPDFFQIIKEDVLQSHLIRKDIRWHYDIAYDQSSKSLRLDRTIRYHLYNMSSQEQRETVFLAYLETVHSQTTPTSMKYRLEGETEFTALPMQVRDKAGVKISSEEDIAVPPFKSAELVIVISQVFPRHYIYETHFLNKPAINLELSVNLPEGFHFSVNSSMSSELELVVDEPRKKIYSVKGGIYRGQGIEFNCWRDEPTEVAEQEGVSRPARVEGEQS